VTLSDIPNGLRPHFQEYDPRTLDLERDANLIIQRTLEYGTWDEVRWLFGTYSGLRIRTFVRERVATIEEIGAMKLAAIIDRGTRKDLVDLYHILQQVPIERLFEIAAVKYARVRTFAISATRALAYFDDAEALPIAADD
jgi:hypothetical protein